MIKNRTARAPRLAGLTRSALAQHTDRSGLTEPPDLLMTVCAADPQSGGHLILVDGSAVLLDLAENAPLALSALSTPRSALFGGADGHLGSVFTHKPDDVVAIRLRLDRLVRFNPAVARHLATLRAAIDRHTHIVPARTGVGYVLDNHHWLHGRRAYTGPRLLYRINAEARPGTILCGFRPTAPPTTADSERSRVLRPNGCKVAE